MMVKKNLDLELQALHMIQQRNGVVPKVFKSGKKQLNQSLVILDYILVQSHHRLHCLCSLRACH